MRILYLLVSERVLQIEPLGGRLGELLLTRDSRGAQGFLIVGLGVDTAGFAAAGGVAGYWTL